MRTAWETFPIEFTGGLMTNVNPLQQGINFPGSASKLINFEPSIEGGYKKILGFNKWTTEVVPGTGLVQGVILVSPDDCIAVRAGKYYLSEGKAAWVEKYDSTISTPNKVRHATFNFDGTEKIVMVNGLTKPIYYESATNTIVQDSAAPADVLGASIVVEHKNRLFFAKDSFLTFTVQYDELDYTPGNGAGVINIGSATYKKLVKTGGTSGASRGGENTTPSNGTSPTWVELEFKPGTYVSEQRITSEALEDATIDVGADLENEMGIEFAEMEGTDFISGNGINGPRGLTDYTAVANASYAWGSVGYVASGHASSWASSNPSDYLIDLVHSLKRQYRAGASFIMNDTTLGSIRKLKDGQGNYLWGMTRETFMAGAVGTLLGYPVVTDDFMADIGANAYPIAFGDFKQAYYVIDRKGVSVLRDPVGAFPHVKFLARRRVGGGIAKFEALKLFKIATS